MTPKVSVILPVKNGQRFIDEALQSVVKNLETISHEIIVINDGSTDQTKKVLTPWMNKIVYTEMDDSVAAARNKGVQLSHGEYIAFIDADDVWATNHIKHLMFLFEEYPHIKVAMGFTQRYRDVGIKPMHAPLQDNPRYDHAVFMPCFGSGLFKKEVFQQVGPVTGKYIWHEDVDWLLRAIEKNVPLVITKNVVLWYRVHDANMTKMSRTNDHGLLQLLSDSLQRRHQKTIDSFSKFIV